MKRKYVIYQAKAVKMDCFCRLSLLYVSLNVCLFWTSTLRPVHGQTVNVTFSSPVCRTECPADKRCLTDNVTVKWDYVNGDNYLCKTHNACYGTQSDYIENTPSSSFFPVRLKPVDIARGSSVYFISKGIGGTSFPFGVYDVSRGHFLNCSSAGGLQVSNGLITQMKVPYRFLSSIGYKFFIASGSLFYRCDFGLRLHMNVKDATNCSGFPSLPAGSQLCSGKGWCLSDSFTAGMLCECCDGYTGQFCEEHNGCFTDPCKRGNCTDIVAGHRQVFTCSCPQGYTGLTCDIDIDDCVSRPCQNGGLCTDGLNSYTCLCPPEFYGSHCEHISNLCEKLKPCQNNGTCSRVGIHKQSYVCHCAPGFTGKNCSINATVSSSLFTIYSSRMLSTPFLSVVSDMSTAAISSSVLVHQTDSVTLSSSLIQTSLKPTVSSSFLTEAPLNTSGQYSPDSKSLLSPISLPNLTGTSPSTVQDSFLSLTVTSTSSERLHSSSVLVLSTMQYSGRNTSSYISVVGSQLSSTLSATQGLSSPVSPVLTIQPASSGSTILSTIKTDKRSIAKSITTDLQSSYELSYTDLLDISKTASVTIVKATTTVPTMSLVKTDLQTGLSLPTRRSSPKTHSLMETAFSSKLISQTISVSSEHVQSLQMSTTTAAELSPEITPSIKSSLFRSNSSSLYSLTSYDMSISAVSMVTSSFSPQVSIVIPSMSPTPALPSTLSRNSVMVTSEIPSSSPTMISPSSTHGTPSSSVQPPTTKPPLENQTCVNHPCGENGVCTSIANPVTGLQFSCDCKYPTVGPVCTTDTDLHFPFFSGKSYIKHKPIIFGSSLNQLIVSFYTTTDGTILYSGHKSFQDFVKLEVLGGKLQFTVDAGEGVVSVTSSEIVTDGNTTAAILVYDTRTGTVSIAINNGSTSSSTTKGRLRSVQLYESLYLGGIIPSDFTANKKDVGAITPFVGCIRELEFNDRAILLSDALDWQNISECDLPACRALPCKNGGDCVQDLGNANEYFCQCPDSYSGKNCEQKHACSVNICNAGMCLNTSTVQQCLCPFGKGGVSCGQDLLINIPSFTVTSGYSSYLEYHTPEGVVDQLDIYLEIKFLNNTLARQSSLLFYVGLHDHLSVGSDGDYLALGVENNRILLQYNLGSGPARIMSRHELSLDQEWFTILAGRKGREGYLYIDNNDLQEGLSPPPLVALNVFGHMYLGGIPDVSQLNSEVPFKEGFRGSIKDARIRTGSSNAWLSLSMKHLSNGSSELGVVAGLNIQNDLVNTCMARACQNNGSCESLGASYMCRCPPMWSGLTCNDTAVPCREYNPCYARSTCRVRDSGLTCDCPPGKAGKYCQNDINITTPYFQEYSYLSFSLDAINVQSKTSLRIVFSPSTGDAILFYITKEIKSLSGDFLSITLHDRHVNLIYNLGTGTGECKSQNAVHINQRNELVVTRELKVATLEVNDERTSCESMGPAVGLNVAPVFYLGGVPDLGHVQPLAYENAKDLRDYTGCVHNLTVNDVQFDLSQRGVQRGRNVLNCDASKLVV